MYYMRLRGDTISVHRSQGDTNEVCRNYMRTKFQYTEIRGDKIPVHTHSRETPSPTINNVHPLLKIYYILSENSTSTQILV